GDGAHAVVVVVGAEVRRVAAGSRRAADPVLRDALLVVELPGPLVARAREGERQVLPRGAGLIGRPDEADAVGHALDRLIVVELVDELARELTRGERGRARDGAANLLRCAGPGDGSRPALSSAADEHPPAAVTRLIAVELLSAGHG